MTTALQTLNGATLESVLIGGDLSKLTPDQRTQYYKAVCDSVGLNPLTKPFDYIQLNGKLTLYAKRDCTDQLRNIHGVSVAIQNRETHDGLYVVTARASVGGRADESIGAVSIANLKGDALANACMKAETKAKRRVTLSICGLGWLDETEVETIHEAKPALPAPNGKKDSPAVSLLKQLGWTREYIVEYLQKNFEVDALSKLNVTQMEDLTAKLEAEVLAEFQDVATRED